MNKPFSQACENNKRPILEKLKPFLAGVSDVLEIGSGTGQHSVYFTEHLHHLHWHTSDLAVNHPGILQWHNDAQRANLHPPITLDLRQPWPVKTFSAIFTANTMHIVSEPLVRRFFEGVSAHLAEAGRVGIYGPFKYKGHYTSDSNERFDAFLKAKDPESGIRDIELIVALAEQAGVYLIEDHAMPANNQLLFFERQ